MDNVQSIINTLPVINNSIFLHWLLPAITIYSTTKLAPKIVEGYYLCKDFKPKNINQVILPPELSIENENIVIEQESEKIRDYLNNFVNVLKNNFNEENLSNLYNNINNLIVNVQNTEKYGIKSKSFAHYNSIDNKINVSEDWIDFAIYHELFHMASTYYTSDVTYCGFSQIVLKNPQYVLAEGLNEGYTDLLKMRYFPDGNSSMSKLYKNPSIYNMLTIFVSLVEQIIGKEKMENLYLNCNLPGLIEELKKYSSEKEIMNLFNKLDLLNKYHWPDNGNLGLKDKLFLVTTMKDINKFLFKINSKKLAKQYNDRIINDDQLNDYLMNFSDGMPKKIFINNAEIYVVDIKSMEKILNQEFKNVLNFEISTNENKKLH